MPRYRFSVIVIFAILLWISFCSFGVFADTDGDYTYSVYEIGAVIEKAEPSVSGDVIIPATLGGAPVTVIGANAFEGCSGITSVVIPDTVEKIEKYAFYNCSALSRVKAPRSLKKIEAYAFYGCNALHGFDLYSGVNTIGDYAFYGSGIESIELPPAVLTVGDYAFAKCGKLGSVKMHGAPYISQKAFFSSGGEASDPVFTFYKRSFKVTDNEDTISPVYVLECIESDLQVIQYGEKYSRDLRFIHSEEECVFNVKIKSAVAFKQEGNCVSGDLFGYSCVCGRVNKSNCFEGDKKPHIFSKADTDDKYKAYDATCHTKARYYYSCETCGVKGESIFECGEYSHSVGNELSYNSTSHFYKCIHCNYIESAVPHSFDEGGKCVHCGFNEGSGVFVIGTVISFGNKSDIIKAELIPINEGETLTVEGSGNITDLSFAALSPGKYTLRVSKPKHAPLERTVEISEDMAFDITLHLYGDVNGDGRINASDATQIKRYYNNKASVFSSADEEELAYLAVVSDVNGDGAVNAADATQIKRHYNNKTSVFDRIG